MSEVENVLDAELENVDDAVIGRALRWSLLVATMVAVPIGSGIYWLNRPRPGAPLLSTPFQAPAMRPISRSEIPAVAFSDITDGAGIEFVHTTGARGEKLLPETMGSGCAFFDYNNDGAPDLLLINSSHWPGQEPAGQPPPSMVLYQNDSNGRFRDVTAEAGLQHTFYGMGMAIGDFDNDGWSDVFISAVGQNRLFHNREGHFVEVTQAAGVGGDRTAWSTACGWFDYNNDGLLDLVVANYVEWSPEIDISLDRTLDGVNRAYLPPTTFQGTFPYLYRNDGNGRFTDVSQEAGIQIKNPATGLPMAKTLGLSLVDFDGDGWMDIVLANDTVQNFCFRNRGDGTFDEIGAGMGIAFDSSGQARGAMGIDAARFRNGPDLGLVIGNFANEMTGLYVAQGDAWMFTDEAIATGLGPATRLLLTFGIFFFDYDLDGRLDILAANGHLEDDISKIQESQRYEQPPQLFWNAGPEEPTEFLAVPPTKAGPDFHRPLVGRGATYADIDGDGDLDVLITTSGGRPRLLRNDQQLGHRHLRFRLIGTRSNRDSIGAWVEVHAGGQVLARQVSRTHSYLSQCELPVTFGLGKLTHVDRVLIRWPDGSQQEVPVEGVDRLIEVRQAPSRHPREIR